MATSDCSQNLVLETAMKRLIIYTAVLALAFSSAAQAKGCIKGAIVGGVAGSVAGHGKVGAAAGCVIGHHEAKTDAEKAKAQAPTSPSRGDGKN
jgi:outer membrane lipoprotein SlyB